MGVVKPILSTSISVKKLCSGVSPDIPTAPKSVPDIDNLINPRLLEYNRLNSNMDTETTSLLPLEPCEQPPTTSTKGGLDHKLLDSHSSESSISNIETPTSKPESPGSVNGLDNDPASLSDTLSGDDNEGSADTDNSQMLLAMADGNMNDTQLCAVE